MQRQAKNDIFSSRSPWYPVIHINLPALLRRVSIVLLAAASITALAADNPVALDIGASDLGTALNALALNTSTVIYFDAALTKDKRTSGLQGEYSIAAALSQLLQDSGLQAKRQTDGSYRVVAAKDAEESVALPRVKISGSRVKISGSVLPEEYAGGQVARGGRIGLLGNRDIFDTPFSVTGYTAELIENQQARTVGDVIQNDSSVQLIAGAKSSFQTISIRGFNIGGTGVSLYDGFIDYSRSSLTVRTLERVEIFKGPNALLNGTASNVSGAINLVPKRPTETTLTRLTADYDYRSRFGAHADLSRRFGSKKQFGTRLNAVYHKGEAAIEDNEEELGEVALALEYRTDKLRLETILDYNSQHLDRRNQLFILDSRAASVPSVPDTDDAIQQPWERRDEKFARALLRAEYSLDKTWTIHAAYITVDSESSTARSIGRGLNSNGNFNVSPQAIEGIITSYSWNAGIRGQFKTGEITHQLSVETMRSSRQGKSDFVAGRPSFTSNLYQPGFIARPQLFDRITLNPTKTQDSVHSSIAIADTMGFFDERVLLTAGIRRQTIDAKRFNRRTGMRTNRYEKSVNTPAVGLVVKPWSFMSIYGNYIEALEQGLSAPRFAINAGEVFPPTVTEQIEFGMKFDLNGLGLTAGVFQIERPNRISENRRFSMDGEQRNRGLELNAFGELRPNLRLLGGITYIDGELTRTQDGRFDGNDAPGVPELAAVLNLEWDALVLPGLTLTARAEHIGSKYIRADNSLKLSSYQLYGIGARYKRTIGDQQFTLRMNIDNLLNKDYWNAFTGASVLYLGAPRRMNLSVSMDF